MKTIVSAAAMAVFVACGAHADDKNVEQMKQLYTKIRNIVNVTDNEVRPGGTYLVLLNPGIILDPNLHPDTNDADRLALNSVIDRTMESGWIYRPYSQLTTDVYARILDFHATPDFKLPVATKAELDALNAKLYRTVDGRRVRTEAYNQYQEYLGAYSTAIDVRKAWVNDHPGQIPPSSLTVAEKNARDDYFTLGDGAVFSRQLQRKHEIEAYDPGFWWGELNDAYQAYTDGGATPAKRLPNNLYYPKYATWLDTARSWTNYTISQSDLERTTSDGSTSTGGGLGASWGLFRISGSGSGTKTWNTVDATYTGMTLSFEMTRVNIYRPWMDTTVFYTDAWCWGMGAPDLTPVSTGGDPSKGQQLSGTMPFLPTGILLARNVDVSAKWSRDISNDFTNAVSGGGGISFGPFSFGGSHSEFHHDTYTHGTSSGSGFKFKEAQIIGFFVEVLPRSPNPNPNLKFSACKPAPTPPGPAAATASAETNFGLLPEIAAQLRKPELALDGPADPVFLEQNLLRFNTLLPSNTDGK